MANEIYNSSYWGNGVCDNAIDWGVVYKDFAGCTPSFSNTFSLSFDGVDDYVDCGTELGNSFGVTTNISISMWINPSVTSGNDLFFNIGSFSNSFGQIAFQLLSNKLYVKLNNGARSYNVAYTNTTDWQHLVFIYDGSNSANTKMYINNVEQSTTVAGVFPSSLDLSNLKTIIGGGYSVSYTYSGLQDEVAIFNTTLTSANVTSIYNSGVPNDISSISGLTAWYRMGDNGSYKSPQWLIPENSNVANSRISNYSFSYDGVDDIISMGDVLDFDYNEPFTISAWINLEAFSYSFAGVVSKQDTSGNFRGYFLHIDETSGVYNLKFILGNTLSNRIKIQGTTDLLGLGWTHIACTYDGSTNASGTKLYINGSLETLNAGLTQDTLGSNTTLNSASFNIGSRGGSRFFEGNIDEVSVFNSELSSTDINSLYGGGNPTTITGAVAHWKMGEEATFSTNWTIPDGVGSSDGTSANMTIEDRIGNASMSSNNAVSFNQIEADRETDVPT